MSPALPPRAGYHSGDSPPGGTRIGYPVIPTIDRAANLDLLPDLPQYVAKPKFGADSVGLEMVAQKDLARLVYDNLLVQPRIDFHYEVSFYFIDRTFQYALYAPEPDQRWALEPYEPTEADLTFAQRFVDWNDVRRGIQRVDGCRTRDGELLLVELEDLNPYLSLDRIAPAIRDAFVDNLTTSILALTST